MEMKPIDCLAEICYLKAGANGTDACICKCDCGTARLIVGRIDSYCSDSLDLPYRTLIVVPGDVKVAFLLPIGYRPLSIRNL